MSREASCSPAHCDAVEATTFEVVDPKQALRLLVLGFVVCLLVLLGILLQAPCQGITTGGWKGPV
jgi:hypothetical protein